MHSYVTGDRVGVAVVGFGVGVIVGVLVGVLVGDSVGVEDGLDVGKLDGERVSIGEGVGEIEGCSVGIGALVSIQVIMKLHSSVISALWQPQA